jgi:predicted ATPase
LRKDFDFNIEGENILLRWQHVNDLSNLGFSAQTLSDGTARFICMATLFLQPKDLRPETFRLTTQQTLTPSFPHLISVNPISQIFFIQSFKF